MTMSSNSLAIKLWVVLMNFNCYVLIFSTNDFHIQKNIILFKAQNYNFPIFEQILKANIKNNFFPFNQDFCISREERGKREREKRRLIR